MTAAAVLNESPLTVPNCVRKCGRLATRYLPGPVRDTPYCDDCSPTQVKDVARLRPIAERKPRVPATPPSRIQPRREDIRVEVQYSIDEILRRAGAEIMERFVVTDSGEELREVREALGRIGVKSVLHLESEIHEWVRDMERMKKEARDREDSARLLSREVLRLKGELDRERAEFTKQIDKLKADLAAAEAVASEALEGLPAASGSEVSDAMDRALGRANELLAPAGVRLERPARQRVEPDTGRATGALQLYVDKQATAARNATPAIAAPTVIVATAAEKDYMKLAAPLQSSLERGLKQWLHNDSRVPLKKRSGNSRTPKASGPNSYALHIGRLWVLLEKGLAAASYTMTGIESDH